MRKGLAEMLPTVRLVIQPGASHYPWLDDAGRFVAAAAMTEAYIGSSVSMGSSAGGRPFADGIVDPDFDIGVRPGLTGGHLHRRMGE
jgi:hypothetical protein